MVRRFVCGYCRRRRQPLFEVLSNTLAIYEECPCDGGLGRLGRWTVDHFIEAGWDVTCVDADHSGFGETPRPGVTFRAGDLANAGETRAITQESAPDHVIHLAAIPNPEVYAGPRVLENDS
ncbi:NAD-dependent epimerase/dehydratase family protein [Halegenticoccus tardaugens]|uniref:NAD-dependent epimerase/dehydratase family protein n=1 Tax=Halegenticoccus tardaugens TaxID=2071624 RepID=UPI002B2743C5|nr:NAD-dependent epimerase/dehydratase family protein [Halegenticoccus tardaugens]